MNVPTWLRKLLAQASPTGTRLEQWIQSASPERLAATAQNETEKGFATATGFSAITTAAELLVTMRKAKLKAYLSSTNADVIVFEACALLLGQAWRQIAPNATERERDAEPGDAEKRFIMAMVGAGHIFEEYSGFENAPELLVSRSQRLRIDPESANNDLTATLIAAAGCRAPLRSRPDGIELGGQFETHVFIPPSVMIFVASWSPYFLKVATTMMRHPVRA